MPEFAFKITRLAAQPVVLSPEDAAIVRRMLDEEAARFRRLIEVAIMGALPSPERQQDCYFDGVAGFLREVDQALPPAPPEDQR